MNITTDFKSRFLAASRAYLPTAVIENPNFDGAIEIHLSDLVDLGTDAVCAARVRGLNLSCRPADLAERILVTPGGLEVIAGARFKNLDVSFPFVEVHSSRELGRDDIRELRRILSHDFRAIGPLGFKFRARPNAYPEFETWSHSVFGSIPVGAASPIESGPTFSFVKDFAWVSRYVAEYEDRLVTKPELVGFVRIASRDEFEEAAVADALMVIRDDLGFAGVVAGVASPFYGLPALYVIESYLSPRWIGRGLAPRAHAFFFGHLAARFRYVWGTIYDRNVSSLKTALRTGREIVESEYFVSF